MHGALAYGRAAAAGRSTVFTNVLVALKEGLDHQPLLDLAQAAAPPPARIHLLTLVRLSSTDAGEQRVQQAQERLGQAARSLQDKGHEASVQAEVVVMAAAADITRIAGERGADLIVIGLAKRTRVGKALLGSDAQRILLSAGCPVLVTHLFGR